MPLLLTHTSCQACGHEHSFTLLQGTLEAGREYGYFCPDRGVMTDLVGPNAGATVAHPPQGTVVLIASINAVPMSRAA